MLFRSNSLEDVTKAPEREVFLSRPLSRSVLIHINFTVVPGNQLMLERKALWQVAKKVCHSQCRFPS